LLLLWWMIRMRVSKTSSISAYQLGGYFSDV
jgi:hypothetical protein